MYAPFQPACITDIIFWLESKIKIGAQSAVNTASAYLLLEVINASPIGFFLGIFIILIRSNYTIKTNQL